MGYLVPIPEDTDDDGRIEFNGKFRDRDNGDLGYISRNVSTNAIVFVVVDDFDVTPGSPDGLPSLPTTDSGTIPPDEGDIGHS